MKTDGDSREVVELNHVASYEGFMFALKHSRASPGRINTNGFGRVHM